MGEEEATAVPAAVEPVPVAVLLAVLQQFALAERAQEVAVAFVPSMGTQVQTTSLVRTVRTQVQKEAEPGEASGA